MDKEKFAALLVEEFRVLREHIDQELFEFAKGISEQFKEVEMLEFNEASLPWKLVLKEQSAHADEESTDGQRPEQDTDRAIWPMDEKEVLVNRGEDSFGLQAVVDEEIAKHENREPEPIEIITGMAKFKTAKGWYLKMFDDEGNIDDQGNEWLCSTFVNWIQKLPKSISGRTSERGDRSYPNKTKSGVYCNDREMLYIEQLAAEQKVAIQQKEFERRE